MQPENSIIELCHVVEDMDSALEYWTKAFRAGPFYVFDVPVLPGQQYYGEPTEVSMKVAFGFTGGVLIELLQQTNDGRSPFVDFLKKKGPGLHHVMPRADFDTKFRELSDQGYAVAFRGQMPTGERFCLFDMVDTHGHYVELMDMSSASAQMLERMAAAHREWDGTTNPVRSITDLG